MVVDATIQKWVTLVAREEAGPEGFGWSVQWIATIFYVDNGIFTSPRPARLQVVLNIRTELFDHVCLRMNITKTGEMVCQPRQMAGRNSEAT